MPSRAACAAADLARGLVERRSAQLERHGILNLTGADEAPESAGTVSVIEPRLDIGELIDVRRVLTVDTAGIGCDTRGVSLGDPT